jgi:hypothetical protein
VKAKDVFGIVFLCFLITMAVSWFVNIYNLTQCDYEAPYKCEAMGVVGVIPLASPFIAWQDWGK